MVIPVELRERIRSRLRSLGLAIGKLADYISLITVILILAVLLFNRRQTCAMTRVLIATSNPGKLRDFAGAAAPLGIAIESLPNFASIPTAVEDGLTFEANARKKAEYYSAFSPGEIILADDSGLEVDRAGRRSRSSLRTLCR